MTLTRLFPFLLPALLIACGQKPVNTDDPDNPPQPDNPPVPEVTADPVSMSISDKGAHDITITPEGDGQWWLATTGTDPFLYTEKLGSTLDDALRVISFEYRCLTGIDDLQIFFGNTISEARSRHFGAIPATVGDAWGTFSCVIARDRIDFGWGSEGERLRMDIGNQNGRSVHIRKLQVREMNADEKKAWEEELSRAQGKDAEAARISNYLSRNYSCSVTEVSVEADKVTVKGRTDGGSGYSLVDIAPWESLTELSSFNIASDLSSSSFSVTIPRAVDRDGLPAYDRLLSRFAVVKTEGASRTLCSHARYADKIATVSTPPALSPRSKKGLGGFIYNENLSDLDDLGISSVTVNIVLNSIVNTVRVANYTIAHQYGGKTYYMDTGNVTNLDKVLRECSKRDIVVSAILLNRQSDTNSSATALLKHPECDGGNYSMPNLTAADAENVYAAVLDFLAKRYNGSSYGRVHHWIMHNEVDFQKEWTNMGDQPELRYMDSYVRSMRICHNIARQYDPNAAVLISLTHCWARAEGQYAPKKMLEDLCRYSAAEGDFRWGIAYHPYPQSLAKPEFWKDDTSSTYSEDSPYCTFKNLEVVSSWVSDKTHFHGGSKRILFLSENGTNSPSYSESDLAKQAAGAAWAWKKVAALDGIDGIQWHNWRDNRYEGGLRIGLRRFSDDTDDPNGRKPSWFVWQAAGTADEAAVFDQYLSVIGVNSWADIFNH